MSKDVNTVAILVPTGASVHSRPSPQKKYLQITIPTHSRKLKSHKTSELSKVTEAKGDAAKSRKR